MLIPGLVSITFRNLTPREIITICKTNRLKAIEWGGDIHVPHGKITQAQDIAKQTQDAGLSVAAYGSYYKCGVSEAEGLPFRTVLETAVALGAPSIRVWTGNQSSAEIDDAQRSKLAEDCYRICDLASNHGIKVALEYHLNTLTDTPESTSEFLKDVNHPNLFSLWQPFPDTSAECGLNQIGQLDEWLLNLHVFHWRNDPPKRRALSEGIKPWQAWIEYLKDSPRTHFLLLEFVRNNSSEALAEDAHILHQLCA